jgi:hypothetical protein
VWYALIMGLKRFLGFIKNMKSKEREREREREKEK